MAFASTSCYDDLEPQGTTNLALEEHNDPNLKFVKRNGAVEVSGHFYEIYLCMLILLKKEEVRVEEIYLASNIKIGADFDDVVLKVVYEDSDKIRRCRVIFVQAKHKKNLIKAPKVGFDLLLSESKDFSLKKYFKSYREIKQYFRNQNKSDLILNSDFEDCEFVLYTNLLPYEKFESYGTVRRVPVGRDDFLNFQEENHYYRLRFDEDDEMTQKLICFLKDATDENDVEQEIEEFLSKFKLFIHQPGTDDLEAIIKRKIQSIYKIKPNNTFSTFSEIKNKVFIWWEKANHYLTKSNTYFEDSARINIFNVKAPVEPFMGRKQELMKLHEMLQNSTLPLTVISQTTSVCGLGGIGKTELARKYAHEFSKQYDNNIIWINAENEETLTESFITIAKDKLQILTDSSGMNKDIGSIVGEIYNFFSERNRKCLFIFDNADENKFLYKFLPLNCLKPDDKKPFILITSRNQAWEKGIEILTLDVLEPEEAEEFLKQALHITDQDEAIKQLVSKVQRFPLALEQAAAYIHTERAIHNKKYTVEDYLKQYNVQTKKLLDYEGFQGIINQYTKTTFTTWKMSIDKILTHGEVGTSALQVFHMSAYCAPENIPTKIFLKLTNYDEVRLKNVTNLIAKYSLIKSDEDTFSVHRLVQEVTRLNLQNQGEDRDVLKLLLESIASNISPQSIEHAMSIWKYSNTFKDLVIDNFTLWEDVTDSLIYPMDARSRAKEALLLAKTLDRHVESTKNINVDGRIKSKLITVKILLWLTKTEEAKAVCNDILNRFETLLGSNHPLIHAVKGVIATSLTLTGKYSEAINIYQEISDKTSMSLGSKTLTMQHSIADIYLRQRKYDEAMNVFNNVLDKQIKMLGQDHSDTLATQTLKAEVLEKQCKYKEAIQLLENILEIQSRVLGAENFDTLSTQSSIANVLTKQGQYENALSMFTEILEKQIKIIHRFNQNTLNAQHNALSLVKSEEKSNSKQQSKPLVNEYSKSLFTQHNIVNILADQGKYKEAVHIFHELFKEQVETLGSKHQMSLRQQHGLIVLLSIQGKYKEAMDLLKNMFKVQTTLLQEENHKVWSTRSNLANILSNQGRYNESMKIFNEVLDEQTTILGTDNIDILQTQQRIFWSLTKQGKEREATELLNQMGENLVRMADNGLIMEFDVVGIFSDQGKYDEAMNLFNKYLEKKSNILGSDHQDCLTIQHKMAVLLTKQGKHDEAMKLFQMVYEKQTNILGENHPDTVLTQHKITNILLKLGKYDQVIRSNEAFEKQTVDHQDILKRQYNLARSLNGQGKCEEAMEMLKNVFETQTKFLGESHPDTLLTQRSRANTFSKQGKHDEALTMFNEIFEKQIEILGKDHQETLRTQHSIALIFAKQGKNNEAMERFKTVLARQIEVLGKEHSDTLFTEYNIANILSKEGEHQEAMNMLNETFKKQTTGHQDALRKQHLLGELLAKQGKHNEAMNLLNNVLEKKINLLGEDHPDTLITQRYMATILVKQGKLNDAMNTFYEVSEKQSRVLGEDHQETLRTQHSIALIFARQSKYEEALIQFKNVLENQIKILGEEHLDVIITQCNIANALSKQDKDDEALGMFKEVLNKQIRVFGTDHPHTLNMEHRISQLLSKRDNHKQEEGVVKENYF